MRSTGIKWFLAVGLPALLLVALSHFDMSQSHRFFFAISLWAALAWALAILPDAVVGLAVPVLFVLAKVATPAQAFSPWLSSVPWIILGGLFVGAVMMDTGLAKRLAYWWIIRLGSTFPRILSGLMLAGLIMAPLMPSTIGKISIMSVIGVGVCQVLRLPLQSRAASAVMLTCFFAVACPALGYMTGGLQVIVAAGFLANHTAQGLSWFAYAYHNWLLGLVYSLVSVSLVFALLKPETPIAAIADLKKDYEAMGPVKGGERKAVAILALIFAGLATDRLHGIDPAWIMLLATVAFFVPGICLMDKEKMGQVGYPVLLFVTGAMSVGSVAAAIGVSRWLAELIAPLLSGTAFSAVIVAYAAGALSALFIQSVALAGAFTPPLIQAAITEGLAPHPIVYSFIFGTDQVVLPYQYAVLAYVFSFGRLSLRHILRVMIPRLAADTIVLLGVVYPYWKYIGLLK